jgi:hypothetical protein
MDRSSQRVLRAECSRQAKGRSGVPIAVARWRNTEEARAVSLLPVAYVLAALVYLAAGGPASWPLSMVHGLVMIASVSVIVGSILHA